MNEKNYIRYRRIKAFGNKLCFYVCRVFPIDKKLISVCTFEGKGGFGCNPKYVVMELHKRNPEYKFVWFVNKDIFDTKKFPDYIKKVPNTLWNRAYWLSRSKVWIDNYRKPLGTVKRKGQYYLNTWHGMIGFKTIGLWRGKAFSQMAYIVSKNDSDMVDCFLSDSKFCTDYFPKGLVYDGDFLEVGSPRCDVLLKERDEKKKEFYNIHALEESAKCVMFAPTFREGSVNGKREIFSEIWTIDFKRLIQNLETRFGGKWYLILKLHPQLCQDKYVIENVNVIDVSEADDMYDILAAMDVLITDYSSCAMDAEVMHIPVFIYADDIAQYKDARGVFTWNITEKSRFNVKINRDIFPKLEAHLPFTIAKNNEELEEDILNFDETMFEENLKTYESGVKLVRNGMASKKVADKIQKYMEG